MDVIAATVITLALKAAVIVYCLVKGDDEGSDDE